VSSIGVLSIALEFCRDVSVHLAKGAEKAAAASIMDVIGLEHFRKRTSPLLASTALLVDYKYTGQLVLRK